MRMLLSNPYIHVPDATFVHAAAARGSASHGRCTFCRRAIVVVVIYQGADQYIWVCLNMFEHGCIRWVYGIPWYTPNSWPMDCPHIFSQAVWSILGSDPHSTICPAIG